MGCDREILLLISAFHDGEATPDEVARAEAHLACCPSCRKLLAQWLDHRQTFTWAYTRALTDEFDVDTLAHAVGKEQPAMTTPTITRTREITPARPRRWTWAGALAAVLLFAVLLVCGLSAVRYLPVGHTLTTAKAQTVLLNGDVTLRVSPHATIRRLDRRTIRLTQGEIAVSVQHGHSITVLTPRLQVTDRGTRFHVGAGTKSDYLSVEDGAVDVADGDVRHTLQAGQALITTDTGEPTVLTLLLSPDETARWMPLSELHSQFSPGSILGIKFDEGLKRLAVRFPNVRCDGSCVGYSGVATNEGIPYEWSLFQENVGGQQTAIQAHLAQIARALAGEPSDSEYWEIPAAVMQVFGFQRSLGLDNDVYYVCLAPKDGALVWRFHGSRGQQVDQPVTFEAPLGMDAARPVDSLTRINGRTDILPNHDQRTTQVLQMLNWPGNKKPTLKLYFDGSQRLPQWDDGRNILAELQRQCRSIPEIKLNTSTYSSVYYFDPQLKHRMLFVKNDNCGWQLCRAFDLAQQGQKTSVVLGALEVNIPLTEPPADRGPYLVRMVLPGASKAPYEEIATIDNHHVVAWNGPSCLLKSTGLPGERPESGSGNYYELTVPPTFGKIELLSNIRSTSQGAFAFSVLVRGRPDKVLTPMQIPTDNWAIGWIRMKLP